MDPERQGALDSLFRSFGQNLVDPNGAVTDMMDPRAAAAKKAAEEEERRRLLAEQKKEQYKSAMEAAASQPKKMSNWNPMVMLFGQPDGSGGGLLK